LKKIEKPSLRLEPKKVAPLQIGGIKKATTGSFQFRPQAVVNLARKSPAIPLS